jgi:hypothetical protein
MLSILRLTEDQLKAIVSNQNVQFDAQLRRQDNVESNVN